MLRMLEPSALMWRVIKNDKACLHSNEAFLVLKEVCLNFLAAGRRGEVGIIKARLKSLKIQIY